MLVSERAGRPADHAALGRLDFIRGVVASQDARERGDARPDWADRAVERSCRRAARIACRTETARRTLEIEVCVDEVHNCRNEIDN